MAEPIRKQRDMEAPTPQNTPAGSSGVPSSVERRAQQSLASIDESNALGALASNPALLSMIQGRLGTLAGQSSGYIESLPPSVRRRLAGLKGLSFENAKIEAEFQRELLELEKKFYTKQLPVYQRREKIITGEVEPTDDEVTKGEEAFEEEKELFDDVDDDDEDDKEDDKKDDKDSEEKTEPEQDDTRGIPDFWLVALKNLSAVAETITDRDDEVLSYLNDIQLSYLERPGFALKFVFGDNPFFTNKVLTKTYIYQDEIGPTGDFVYDHAEGSDIKWTSPEANVTVRVEKRKQRNKHTKATRTVERSIPVESFFTFFSPPQPPSGDDDDEYDEDIQDRLEMDFDIGELIKVKLIPRAIDWFTGKALEYEGLTQDPEDVYDEEDFEEDDDDDDDDEYEEGKDGEKKDAPAECKQQ